MDKKSHLMTLPNQRSTNHNEIQIGMSSNLKLHGEEQGYALKMVQNGEQHFSFEHKQIRLFPDSFMLLAPGTCYTSSIESDDLVKTLSISISEEFWGLFQEANNMVTDFKPGEVRYIENFPFQSIYPLVDDMRFNISHLYNYMQRSNKDERLINEYIGHCLKIYFANYFKQYEDCVCTLWFIKTATSRNIFRRVQLTKEFISNNYDKTFSLNEVAQASCLSKSHLLRTFKQVFGLSPYQYLATLRLDRAKEILKTKSLSINEIVIKVGFESPSSFIKAFKRSFNITPLNYRKSFHYN